MCYIKYISKVNHERHKTVNTKKITRKNKLSINAKGKVVRTDEFSHYQVAIWNGSFWTFKDVKTMEEAKSL